MRVISCFGRKYYLTEAKAEKSVASQPYACFYPNAPYISYSNLSVTPVFTVNNNVPNDFSDTSRTVIVLH